MKHIREYYKVPVKRGAKITFIDGEGVKHYGTVFSTIGSKLKVRIDRLHSKYQYWILHPTWNVEYI